MTLEGQAALVVGGSGGIGLVTVKELLREGANVVLSDVSPGGADVVKQLQDEFGEGRVVFIQADVRDDVQMEAAFTAVKKNFHRMDIFVNSAAVVNDIAWNLSVDINIKGTIRGMLLAWKHMGKHEGGSGGTVVNIASLVGITVNPFIPVYTATKHAVVGLSRACGDQLHLERTGVRVITICPSQTDTPQLARPREPNLLFPELSDERYRRIATYYTQRPESVAKVILHVIHNAASGSIWISEDDLPAYEVVIPSRQDMRVDH